MEGRSSGESLREEKVRDPATIGEGKMGGRGREERENGGMVL
jgi:hypothetical protein